MEKIKPKHRYDSYIFGLMKKNFVRIFQLVIAIQSNVISTIGRMFALFILYSEKSNRNFKSNRYIIMKSFRR